MLMRSGDGFNSMRDRGRERGEEGAQSVSAALIQGCLWQVQMEAGDA